MKVIENKNMLFARTETECHELRVSPDSDEIMKVWVKEPTWLQVEKALSQIMNINPRNNEMDIDLNKLYKYLVTEFVEKTEPPLEPLDMLRLSPFIGAQLKEVLPNPFLDTEDDTGKAN
tara:strand:- start:25 stop:381 length:357 start_codon:yes stop_codon:yes gene_type:complete